MKQVETSPKSPIKTESQDLHVSPGQCSGSFIFRAAFVCLFLLQGVGGFGMSSVTLKKVGSDCSDSEIGDCLFSFLVPGIELRALCILEWQCT